MKIFHSLARNLEASVLCFLFSLLLFSGGRTAVTASRLKCSSSCGKIHNIKRPFYLAGDPPDCGYPGHELICDGNNTILSLMSGKYYVNEISITPYDIYKIRITDVGMATGECRLPLRSLSYEQIEQDNSYYLYDDDWASFVNCTSVIRDSMYRPIPCLSRNDSFVYVTSKYKVNFLKPSCGFLATIPTDQFAIEYSQRDVFEILQTGFTLEVTGIPNSITGCLRQIRYAWWPQITHIYVFEFMWETIGHIVAFDLRFPACVYESKNTFKFLVAILLVVVLNLLAIFLIGRFIALLSILVFLAYKFWKNHASINVIEKFLRNQRSLTPTRYAYTDIITITGNFREKLGQGGFGSVFKGILPRGQLVAVKMLGNSKCNGDEFINEVATIGRIHHINVVQLVGFCADGSNRALVYEYMPNGSLDKYIFSSSNETNLHPPTWENKLTDIAFGIARGIDYLHRGCDMRILHFDIKPHNILLDRSFNPKIADFGLARLYPKDYSMVSLSLARGTIGYIAPELISRNFGVISHKSDVYSYGMLLMEIAGRRRNVNPHAENSSQIYYPSWIYDRLNKIEVVDTDGIAAISEAEEHFAREIGEVERKLSKVGMWCIQMKASCRPSMSEVLEMLHADVETIPLPPKPFFSSPQPEPIGQSLLNSSLTELSIISE